MDFRILAILIGYCIGLIQTAHIIGRVMGIDIREHGSGNAGATNALRVMGRKVGVTVLLADVFKGVLAFVICALIWNGGGTFSGDGSVLPGLYGAIGAILGHCFPFYMKFKGGKGFATTIGLMMALDFRMFLIVTCVGVIIVLLTRYISLATLVLALMMPIIIYLFGYPLEVVIATALVTALVWFRHRANITRLLKGEENKFSFKKKAVL